MAQRSLFTRALWFVAVGWWAPPASDSYPSKRYSDVTYGRRLNIQ